MSKYLVSYAKIYGGYDVIGNSVEEWDEITEKNINDFEDYEYNSRYDSPKYRTIISITKLDE